jgi:cephalosporin hydroxylase
LIESNSVHDDLEFFKNKYLSWFHKNCVFNNKWMGRQAQKPPLDAWIFQEIIFDTKPNVIVEIGNYAGGALFTWQIF